MSARLIALAIALRGARHRAAIGCPAIYYVNVASQILFYAIFALGLNVLVGYAGLVSLGHAGLFGIAAYATGLHAADRVRSHRGDRCRADRRRSPSMAVFAVLSLRSTGIGFIMITLALGEILWGLAYRWISLTGGDNGISVRTRPEPFGYSLASPNTFYYTTLIDFPAVGGRDGGVRALAVRRLADGHARPAAPHERARLSRLADPLLCLPGVRAC